MSEFKVDTIEKIEREAAGYGCEVVVAKDNELQFDLDTLAARDRFDKFYQTQLYNRFQQMLPLIQWKSRSGNRHVVLTLPSPLTVPERIALQVAGGSDVKRECAALFCHWDGSPHPILLFKPVPKLA